MKFEEIIVSSWSELKEIISSFNPLKHPSNDFLIFRVQSDSSRGLSSSIERYELLLKEREIIEKFRRNAHLYRCFPVWRSILLRQGVGKIPFSGLLGRIDKVGKI